MRQIRWLFGWVLMGGWLWGAIVDASAIGLGRRGDQGRPSRVLRGGRDGVEKAGASSGNRRQRGFLGRFGRGRFSSWTVRRVTEKLAADDRSAGTQPRTTTTSRPSCCGFGIRPGSGQTARTAFGDSDTAERAGKKIYADLQFATPADYLLASACDQIVMPESGTLMLPGVRAEVIFYKNLFDKLGIQADMLQVGDFKGAAEPYTRSEMSESFRRQYELVIDDLYDQMVDTDRDRSTAESGGGQGGDRSGVVDGEAGRGGRADRPSGL